MTGPLRDTAASALGLYIHWPFCQAKCPYCDFNSHVATRIDMERWKIAYLSEIERVFSETPGRILTTVFFGGGTPSLMDPDLVAEILSALQTAAPQANDVEITLEANPSSVEIGRFRAFREAGVNRVSLGLQALNDDDLRRLGRMHSAAEGLQALTTARAVFDRVSFDLIYARQHQTPDDWAAELHRALAFEPDHLSLYQLTIEPGTVFQRRFDQNQLPGLPAEDPAADMFDLTQRICETAGLPAYEVSNHARPGAESRHNLIYWRGGDYAGIGPGAHGRLTRDGIRHATETERMPEAWLSSVETRGSSETSITALSRREEAEERVMMGLRLAEGISLSDIIAIDETAIDHAALAEMQALGLLHVDGDRMTTTPRGRPLLNAILAKLLA